MRSASDTSEPISARIVLALRQRCQDILRAKDYRTDLGQRVLLGRPTLQLEELPAVLVFSHREDPEAKRGKTTYHQNMMACYVEAQAPWSGTDEDQPELVAQDMLADLKRAVFRDSDHNFRQEAGMALVKAIRYGGRVFGYPSDGRRAVSARVLVEIDYLEQYGAPTASV